MHSSTQQNDNLDNQVRALNARLDARHAREAKDRKMAEAAARLLEWRNAR